MEQKNYLQMPRTACPHPRESGYPEVDMLRHRVTGVMRCSKAAFCRKVGRCDWGKQS